MIDEYECINIRKKLHGKSIGAHSDTLTPEGIGDTDIIKATGRATCRCCGKKITKGKLAIVGFTTFGEELWRTQRVQIHFNNC